MTHWSAGFTKAELDDAQARYDIRFPPDLVDLFLDRRPVQGYAWNTEDIRLRKMLEWPLAMLLFDVEQGFWWPEWEARPASAEDRQAIVRDFLSTKPRLIPLLGHRFLPETPFLPGNPVVSMHGFDTVYYGANLEDYFAREFSGQAQASVGECRYIPFWSDLIERFDEAYGYYADSDPGRTSSSKLQSLLRRGAD